STGSRAAAQLATHVRRLGSGDALGLALGEERQQRLLRARLAEQIALALLASDGAQAGQLRVRLDAFGGRRLAERLAAADDGAHDRLLLDVAGNALHERAVDLDLVEGEAAQIAQRRVAGPEVVHGDACAELAQRGQRIEDQVRAVEEQRFRDLELQPARCEAGDGERALDHVADVAAAELYRGEVDRNAHLLRPGRRVAAGAAQDEIAQRPDEARFLGNGDELG